MDRTVVQLSTEDVYDPESFMKKSMLLSGMTAVLFAICTLPLAAQYGSGQTEKQKPQTAEPKTVGKPHTMTGCLEKGADANTFRLTQVEGTGPKTVELHADTSKKLSAHLGHKIAVTGPEIDPSSIQKGTAAKPETGAAAKPSGTDHYMRVDSVKMISTTCPS